jgi:hypothetical protein
VKHEHIIADNHPNLHNVFNHNYAAISRYFIFNHFYIINNLELHVFVFKSVLEPLYYIGRKHYLINMLIISMRLCIQRRFIRVKSDTRPVMKINMIYHNSVCILLAFVLGKWCQIYVNYLPQLLKIVIHI